jgi:hypothetical protein
MQTWKHDKSEHPKRPLGEWTEEPDKAHWISEESGLDCLVVRGPMGALCGYVGVPEKHPLFNKPYQELYDMEVDPIVHGGLTFSSGCSPGDDESHGICHPKEGAAHEKVWWFGFDCGHLGDLIPDMIEFRMKTGMPSLTDGDTYQNFEYVKGEVERLSVQLGGLMT